MDITKIPSIMRHNRWDKGAALMDRWFSGSSAIAPSYARAEKSIITMQWILSFQRAKDIYNQIFLQKIWLNPAAQQVIASRLRDSGLLTRKENQFGRLHDGMVPHGDAFEREYINYKAMSSISLASDDLNAALGRFNFRVVVGGVVTAVPKSQGYKITIARVGVYAKDSYDFNGDQSLGYWDEEDKSLGMTPFSGGSRVSNQDFQDWRIKNGKGGDFLIYSDVKVTNVPPESFVIRQ